MNHGVRKGDGRSTTPLRGSKESDFQAVVGLKWVL